MKLLFRLVVLLSLSSVFLFAGAASDSNYTTDFGIYVYGNIQSIENAFILVQAIATSSAMPWIIALIVAFYLPYSAYSYFKEGNGASFATNLIFMTISVLSLDVTHLGTTIHIEDLRTATNLTGLPAKTYASVDDIPYPIALLTSTVSTITYEIKKVYENAIQVINVANGLDIEGGSSTSVGFGKSMGDILKFSKAASFVTGDANTTLFGRATQAYVNDCALKQAVAINPNLIQSIRNPPKDLFLAIEPAALGIDSDSYKIDFDSGDGKGTQEYTCKDFYKNFIHDKYADEANKLKARLNKNTTSDLNNADVINAMRAVGADVNDSFIASDLGKWQAYAMNVAALGPVRNALRNYGTNVTVPNEKTAAASLAALQTDGIGRFAWMAAILPLGFHYMLGIIYTISILIMIVATALGREKGMMIWKNFAKGLLTFEFIKVALVIVNSSVNQYAAMHAADFIASVGQNPATITSIPYSINYIATMSGVAGILGISAIFMIPAMVFSGEVGMAAGALSGLASSYKGNDAQTAIDVTAKQKATQAAWEKDLQDQASLDHLGLTVPEGMGASQYYAQYKKDAESANAGFGAARMGTGAIDSAAHAVKGQTMQNIQAMSTLDGVATMNDFVSAGTGAGAMMANKLGSDIGYGQTVNAESAKVYGELAGKAKGHADEGTYEGAVNVGVDNYLKGTEDQASKKSASTGSYGKKTSLKEAIDAGRFEGLLSAGKDKTIAADPNLVGDATTLGNLSGDKTLQQAHGAQKAQIYNKDGSDGHEHSKFMLGGEELQRKGYNEKELAMGAAMANKSEEKKKQMMADVEAASGLAMLDDFSHAKGSRKHGGVSHDGDGYIDGLSNENSISWKDTDGKMHHMSRAKANEVLAEAGIMGMVGKGAGIYSQTQSGSNMGVIADNAMASEGANIAGLNKAIQTAGGVDGFVGLKGSSSAVQTAEAIGGTEGKVQEALMKNNPKMSSEQAEAMSKAIVEGSKEGAKQFKDALGTLGSLASTMAGSKTRSDIASIDAAGGSEKFKETQAKSAAGKMASMQSEQHDLDIENKDGGGYIGAMADKGSSTAVATMGAIAKKGLFTKQNMQSFYDKLRNEGFSKDQLSDLLDSQGHVKTEWAAAAAMSAHAAGNLKGQHGLVFGNKAVGASFSKKGVNVQSIDGSFKKDMSQSYNYQYDYKNGVTLKDGFHADVSTLATLTGKYGGKVIDAAVKSAKDGNFKPFKDLVNHIRPDELKTNQDSDNNNGGHFFEKWAGRAVEVGSATAIVYGADKKWNEGRAWGKVKSVFGKEKSSPDSSNPLDQTSNQTSDNKTNNTQENKPSHNDSFQSKDNTIISENGKPIKGFSGASTTESGIILPDHPKEPIPHMGHMPEGRWGKALESISHMGKWGKGLSVAAAALTGVSLMGAENQADVGAILDPLFSSSMGDSTLKYMSPSQNNGSSPAIRTLEAIQNDPGMASAIDTYNTGLNMSTFQNTQPGRTMSFNTRGGELQIMKNSKSGMLRMHLPGQPFATDTNMPYGQFMSALNDPLKQEQFSQMLASTNLTPENSQGMAGASNMSSFRAEMNSSIGTASMNAYRASMGSNQAASMMEGMQEYMEDDMGEIYQDLQDKQDELSSKMDDLL